MATVKHARISKAAVAEALTASFGVQAHAAQRLNVNRSTICKIVKKHPDLQLLIQDLGDQVSDIAESQLMKALRQGAPWAVKYWLDNRGQDRGYGVRKLSFRDEDGKMTVPAVLVTDGRMSIEAWERKYGAMSDDSGDSDETTATTALN